MAKKSNKQGKGGNISRVQRFQQFQQYVDGVEINLPKRVVLMFDKLYEAIEEGDLDAIEYATDQLMGKPTQQIKQDITSDDEKIEGIFIGNLKDDKED